MDFKLHNWWWVTTFITHTKFGQHLASVSVIIGRGYGQILLSWVSWVRMAMASKVFERPISWHYGECFPVAPLRRPGLLLGLGTELNIFQDTNRITSVNYEENNPKQIHKIGHTCPKRHLVKGSDALQNSSWYTVDVTGGFEVRSTQSRFCCFHF